MTPQKVINARVHWIEGSDLLASRGMLLLESNDGGVTWNPIVDVGSQFARLVARSKKLRRLLRGGIHHVRPTTKDEIVIIAFKHVFVVDRVCKKVVAGPIPISGSRPLALAYKDQQLYYGQYSANEERYPMHVWRSHDGGRTWNVAWQFDAIRHIHSVSVDDWTGDIWVTTGDCDIESALWRTSDEFKTLERVLGGSQQFRTVQPVFTADSIYFGTDAPRDRNFIYRIDRRTRQLHQLCQVDGPVFYGIEINGYVFFSTVSEPTHMHRSQFASIWGGTSKEEDWKRLFEFRKDWLPKRLFQYGQVLFPAGRGNGSDLWLIPFATNLDQRSLKFPLKELTNAI